MNEKYKLIELLERGLESQEKPEPIKKLALTESAPVKIEIKLNKHEPCQDTDEKPEVATEEIEESCSIYSFESSDSSSSSNTTNSEAMGSFLKYKKIREKSLAERASSSGSSSSDAVKTRNDFRKIFNTIHYF